MQLYIIEDHFRIQHQDAAQAQRKTQIPDRRFPPGQVVDDTRVVEDAVIANANTCHCCNEPIPVHTRDDNPPGPNKSGPLTRAALEDLMSRPWFTRLWVAQEVNSAVTSQNIIIHCEPLPQTLDHPDDILTYLLAGSHHMSWQLFADLTHERLDYKLWGQATMSARRFPNLFKI